MKTITISDESLRQTKRWARQVKRLDKVWNCILADDGRDKADRMTRVLAMQDSKRVRMGITLSVLLIGVEL